MKPTYPDIPLEPVCKQAALLLSNRDPELLDTSGVKMQLTGQLLELDEAISSMETQLESDRDDPVWRRQCQFNLRLAKNARSSLLAATNCIASCVKHMEATKRHKQSLEDAQAAREAKERRMSLFSSDQQAAREAKERRMSAACSEQHESYKVLASHLRTTHGDAFYFETLFAAGLLKEVKYRKASALPIHLRDKVTFLLPAKVPTIKPSSN